MATAMFCSLRLPQPLLLEGEAGVGKTEAAKALAASLDTPLVRLQCYEGIDAAEALYEWNDPRQLLRVRLAEARGADLREEDLFAREYLVRRPVLQALEHAGPVPSVLLDAESAEWTLGAVLKYREDQELVREQGLEALVGGGCVPAGAGARPAVRRRGARADPARGGAARHARPLGALRRRGPSHPAP